MAKYQAYFIDLDGTIYQGTKQYPSGKRFIDRLRDHQIPYLFVTNNSTKTPEAVADNLSQNHGIATTPDQVYTSAMATADYLKTHVSDQAKIFVIGEAGLTTAIQAAGCTLVDDHQADVVVMGLDRQFTYDKLVQATLAIQAGALFIATNQDTNLPTEAGMLPGAGTLVSALQTATQTAPIIIAKPEAPIMTGACQRLGVAKEDVLMVGDNYQTDILAGINNGIDTLLVYSGVSTPEQIAHVTQKPTYEVASLDDWQL